MVGRLWNERKLAYPPDDASLTARVEAQAERSAT